ncbi:MAG: hypothetical protein Unbinned1322contig1000_18 [Prokaryotic dsDNA virus sp.]|nr:MAG: hypothetical protein Unbinned1322contig1000_18 [Prokaryotic dsDNA virus sp.]
MTMKEECGLCNDGQCYLCKPAKMKEVPGRKVTQKKRMDEAVAKVESDMHEAKGAFAERLNEEMKKGEYGCRRKLARAMKSANSTVTMWECYTPSNFKKLALLCEHLDLDANYLLGLTDEKKTLGEAIAWDTSVESCKFCGTSELLCGEGGVGCTSAKANQ